MGTLLDLKRDEPIHLKRGDILLGILKPYEYDFPWINCHFESTSAFDEIRALFENELTVIQSTDISAWEKSYDPIKSLDLRLVSPDGMNELDDFLLHVKNDEAWFRA